MYLKNYSPATRSHLLKGFSEGFRLGYDGPDMPVAAQNEKISIENSKLVSDKISTEVKAGRISGPFTKPPFKNFHSSPLFTIPKSDGGQRLIHNLSKPAGQSVNDFIPDHLSSVSYQTLDDAFKIIKKIGQGALMAKCDIKDAFRLLPMHPDDYHLLCFEWQGFHYYDKALPMGARCSCQLFETFSDALQWIVNTNFNARSVKILDDFLFIGPPNNNQCKFSLKSFQFVCKDIGVPLKEEKTVSPCTCIIFLGIEIDSILMEARLPQEKLSKICGALESMIGKSKVTLRDLQSLLGLLNFATAVVRPGRAFLRRLFDLTRGIQKPHHRRRLTAEAKADLLAWYQFVSQLNGKSMILEDRWDSNKVFHLFSDASNIGFGGICGKNWFHGLWPLSWEDSHITRKELFALVLGLELFGDRIKNNCILFHCDNESVVYMVNSNTSKDSQLMSLIRRFVLICMKFNILAKAVHVPGNLNVQSDLLSRAQVQKFKDVTPGALPMPVNIPRHLLPT